MGIFMGILRVSAYAYACFLLFQLLQASTPHPGKAAAQPAAALQPTAREVLGGDGCHGCSCS